MPPTVLRGDELRTVVRLAPLAAVDLIIHNGRGEVLLGLRNNEPAKGSYFVPGGITLKNERLHQAFARLRKTRTGYSASFAEARLLGAYDHFSANNRFGEAGYGTHYLVLGYQLKIGDGAPLKPDDQHREMRWWSERDLLNCAQVHDNAKAYFR